MPANLTCINKVYITDREISSYIHFPENGRTMNAFTKKTLLMAQRLMETHSGLEYNSERTGLAIGTKTGPVSAIKKTAETLRHQGYHGINPSFFPNVMLSTALSICTKEIRIHGPCCVFYEDEFDGGAAEKYCAVQLMMNNCDYMLHISVNENTDAVGSLFTRRELTDESCAD